LVKVAAAGVSDLDIVQRDGTMRRMTKLPLVLGYEIAGTVEAVGKDVRHLKVGDRICTKAFRSCGMCRFCRTRMETSSPRAQTDSRWLCRICRTPGRGLRCRTGFP
ncbi:hypothetical protein BZM27_53165, partial [Paraburkholderia steynii]